MSSEKNPDCHKENILMTFLSHKIYLVFHVAQILELFYIFM